MRISLRGLALGLSLVAYGCVSADTDSSTAALGLVSSIDVARDTVGSQDGVVVHWSVTNDGSVAVAIPRWRVPSAALEADLFAVTLDGQPVDYIGKLAKRAAPSAADLVELAPGATIEADIDLADYYRMAPVGDYAIAHVDAVLPVYIAGAAQTVELRSNVSDAVRTEAATEVTLPRNVVTPSYRSCSASQKTKIATAQASAQTYALNAKSYLTAGTRGARYTTWFGAYTASRYSTVASHYTKIANVIQNLTMTFDCSCTDSGTYAYVYPSQPYVVYFCGAFWSAPNTGTDSRAGTIIHETSHFTAVAGTDDWVYGQTGARSLATSNPTKAVDNADSHEYFAENNPALN
ncbi:MAG: hypothetical protein K8W52_00950 [Deltaproteobacteria bacterium]|nr:hypothetical protein [Deltaproteobacteria bacterium]